MKATPTSSILTFFAFLFNFGAVYVLTLMLPFGMSINVWFKILLAFLLTTGEVLAATAAFYVFKEENRPAAKAARPPGNN